MKSFRRRPENELLARARAGQSRKLSISQTAVGTVFAGKRTEEGAQKMNFLKLLLGDEEEFEILIKRFGEFLQRKKGGNTI